ncbi:MAG: EAL domain-containing protein, partial [Mariprofundaceae bacterium]|nr:EAL domain-containing protein [Mariprofundaceae bacterium]
EGATRAVVFTAISGMPRGQEIYISISLPKSFIYAKADKITIRNLIILIIAAGLVFFITWKGGDVFVLRQISLLLAATRELTTGKLSVRAPIIPHGGELSELVSSFNHMAETLEKRTLGINRLNRIYAVLSNINGTILRVRNKNELLQEACRIAVEHGQFKLAWIGLVDEEGKFLRPTAHVGEHEELVHDQVIPLQNNKTDGIRLAGRAIVEQEDIIINDIEADAAFAEWKKRTGVDFCSMAIFLLKVEEKIIGTFSLYTDEPGLFDKQELRLLRELASDASLGLEIIGKEARLYDLAHFDSLTGLPNRHEFESRIRLNIARAANQEKTVAVLVIGIDHLQRIRDELGHRTGDEALRIVSEHLKAFTGKEDEVARIGANEFGLIFPEIDTSLQAASLVEGILKKFPHVLDFEGNEFSLNIHIGATLYPQDGEDAEQLVKNAELAMHHAPLATTERPLAFFSMDMEEQVRQQRWMEQQLRHAIEKNEFELYFQPVMDIRSRTMMGCESLLRWHNDELGDVSPANFIPIAEQNGLIVSIGEWVMARAFQQAADWRQRGLPPVRIVVNVSLKQLSQSDFVDRVRDIRRSVVSGETELMLGIEVTESQLMDNIEQTLDKLEQLKAMGFSIYIDDFGTGYSSLSYLRQLPVDILKIDISFIHDIEHDPNAVSMARGIIALAHSLDLRVIAEGVESPGQLSILEELKCDYVQGYLFARPVPAAQIEDMMGKNI